MALRLSHSHEQACHRQCFILHGRRVNSKIRVTEGLRMLLCACACACVFYRRKESSLGGNCKGHWAQWFYSSIEAEQSLSRRASAHSCKNMSQPAFTGSDNAKRTARRENMAIKILQVGSPLREKHPRNVVNNRCSVRALANGSSRRNDKHYCTMVYVEIRYLTSFKYTYF